MGTDIHYRIEKRNSAGEWKSFWPPLIEIKREMLDDLEDEERKDRKRRLRDLIRTFPGTWKKDYESWNKAFSKKNESPLRIGRNYPLFAVLANLRNESIHSSNSLYSDPFPRLQQALRGVPRNASPEYRWEVRYDAMDGHSHSWCTVEELLSFDWNFGRTCRGFLTRFEYQQLKEIGYPAMYSSYLGNCQEVSHEEMEKLPTWESALSGLFGPHGRIRTRAEWQEPLSASLGDFCTKTLPALRKLGNPKNVRMCFYFDN